MLERERGGIQAGERGLVRAVTEVDSGAWLGHHRARLDRRTRFACHGVLFAYGRTARHGKHAPARFVESSRGIIYATFSSVCHETSRTCFSSLPNSRRETDSASLALDRRRRRCYRGSGARIVELALARQFRRPENARMPYAYGKCSRRDC